MIQARIDKSSGADVSRTNGRMETGYQSVPWGDEGSGQVTQELLSRLENSKIHNYAQRLDNSRVPGLLLDQNAIDRDVAAKYGLPERADLYKLREIIADPRYGFQRLRDYVNKYGFEGLPAVFGPSLLFEQGNPSQPQ